MLIVFCAATLFLFMKRVIYDIEVYFNVFTAVIYSPNQDSWVTFEVSERKNDFDQFCKTIHELADLDFQMVGYNNIGYDYPVIHHLLALHRINPDADWETVTSEARIKSDQIINCPFEARFSMIIWPNDQVIYQVDLYKIHHFDNKARATSLKALEFAMNSEDVGDLPFDVDHRLDEDEIGELLRYNKHDVGETFRFYEHTLPMLEFRDTMSEKMDHDFTNYNDTKIGKQVFVNALEERLGEDACFHWVNKKKTPRQTPRDEIRIAECVFDYVEFQRPEFDAVLRWFKRQTIHETKGVFTELPFYGLHDLLFYCNPKKVKGMLKNVNTVVDGIQFDFGTGGLHACIDPGTCHSDDEMVIIDLDVTSYYPSLAIENTVFPKHLGSEFCDIYEELKERRMTYEKGTPENAALKLALNGVYGDSNNQYSPFYDPFYTMCITINGQLLLCMLSEAAMGIEGLEFLQANTDGITVRIPRDKVTELDTVCAEWEELTQLDLERATYESMFIRDVNNYLAVYEGGGVKRKGAYEYEMGWHQNHSMKIVAKAAEAHLIHGNSVREFIGDHDIDSDFYMLAKCDRSSRLVLESGEQREELQRVNRYYASTDGGSLVKIMPPRSRKITKKMETQWRKLGIEFDREQRKDIAKALQYCNEITPEDLGCEHEDCEEALSDCQPRWREIAQSKDSLVTVINTIEPLYALNTDYYEAEAMKLVDAVK